MKKANNKYYVIRKGRAISSIRVSVITTDIAYQLINLGYSLKRYRHA